MKQILQNLGNGETILADVPCPNRSRGTLLCQTTRSLVSLGTEKMLIDFGRGGWLAKAKSQPDKVKQVIQKVKTDGLWSTIETVRAKLDTPIPLGYSNAGVVVDCDPTSEFAVGDRVITNGNHAEFVAVSENLAAKIPDGVSDEAAAFTVVGAIALQGVRLLTPTLGESVVVSGLGLIGLMAVQILRANGCRVLGIDFDAEKLKLARLFGAETVDLSAGQDCIKIAQQWTQGNGVDAVLITASTKSDELVHQAAEMCRKRGRIVLVGVIGLNLRRADFYEKELSFQVSCSYGPGRYETNYEKKGYDYPIGFVRWTEQRNFEAILDLMSQGRIDVSPLITHRYVFDKALDAYQAINERGAMGIVLDYGPSELAKERKVSLDLTDAVGTQGKLGKVSIAFLGAGGFTTRMLLPLLPKNRVVLDTIVSSTGVSAAHAAKKFGFAKAASTAETMWADPTVDAAFIATPHNSHATLVCRALDSGKHVFVEKPLALRHDELQLVQEALDRHPDRCLMVGFNRRFSPHTVAISKWMKSAPGAKSLIITVNAGAIPADHWTQDLQVGGGRIVGEACHFIDLARAIVGAPVREMRATAMAGGDGAMGDCCSLTFSYEDGSMATIHYLSNGSKDFPKERVEVFAAGKVFVIDNFRRSFVVGGKEKFKTYSQDKGHQAELLAFIDAIDKGGAWPISKAELFEVSRLVIDADTQIRKQLVESR